MFQSNGQRPRVDRFVAPRGSFEEMRRRSSWNLTCDQRNIDIWDAKYLQQKKYTSYLDEAFGLEPLKTQDSQFEFENSVQVWPCTPRRKPCLSSADSILDLPSYSYAAFPELLDWNNDNILVAALGKNYHKWSWRTQSLISQGIAQYEIQCCKFDPRGDWMLLGTDMRIVEIHSDARNKALTSINCKCQHVGQDHCTITALDWSPTGNSFVTGCSRGMVVAFSRYSLLIGMRQTLREAVLALRVSPDARYLAMTYVNTSLIKVLTWPSLGLLSSIESDWTVKTLTWHPWRSALLGVGAVTPELHARVALWDAPTERVKEMNIGHNRYSLDAMLFSHRTGEMVLSLWDSETTVAYPKTCSHLVVMSDADTVVDHWGEGRSGLDRVRTMIFSPDGTKLATATADEDLIIWNFLPEEKSKKKNNKSRRFSALPVYLDESVYGFAFR